MSTDQEKYIETLRSAYRPPKLPEATPAIAERPEVFQYGDFRDYLKDCFAYLRGKNPNYTETAFTRQAGIGQNSRGYLGLILEKKRNLSQKSVMGFAMALKLSEREGRYFENLVFYNQAKTEKDKAYYFQRLGSAAKGRPSRAFEVLESQYRYFSQWYIVAVRELVVLPDFQEDPAWIIQKLRGKVVRKEVAEAFETLFTLGLLERDESGRLRQTQEFVRFADDVMNHQVANQVHRQLLEQSIDSLDEDDYEDRSISHVMLACDSSRFEEMRAEIREFRLQLMQKYGNKNEKADCVVNLGIQLRHMTPTNNKNKEANK